MRNATSVKKRSGGRCEAEVLIEIEGNAYTWTRCTNPATEDHHLLTRARGGDILDQFKEDYHHIHLCNGCHRESDGGDAYEGGMLIQGYVVWNKDRTWPLYVGPDTYLQIEYGEGAVPDETS